MTNFGELYERYARDVYRFAVYLSGDPALAQDIAAETFVRAWTADVPIRVATVKAYLFTIARNLHLHHLRKAAKQQALDEAMVDRAVDLQLAAEQKAELRSVLQDMQRLPEADRAALLMRAEEGMTYEEIARSLGLSLVAVKVKIHRARQTLAHLRDNRRELP